MQRFATTLFRYGRDRRGQQAAAVAVVQLGAAKRSREGIDRTCDLRVDDHPEPIMELRRLLTLWSRSRRASVRRRGRFRSVAVGRTEGPGPALVLARPRCCAVWWPAVGGKEKEAVDDCLGDVCDPSVARA